MSVHQTQCPNCQHAFPITDEQLALKQGYVRCGNCKTIFSALDKLTPITNSQTSSVEVVSISSKNLVDEPKKTPADELKALLFDDTSGFNEDGEHVIEDTTSKAQRSSKYKATAASTNDFEIIEDFDEIKPTKIKQPKKITTMGVEDSQNESWLNDLLEEDKRKEALAHKPIEDNKLTVINRQANAVSTMLDELDVGVDVEQALPEDEYRKKVNERFANQVSSQRNVPAKSKGMTLIWLLGCLLLAGLLVVQYVIFNLDSLVKSPSSAKKLTEVCHSLSLPCNLPVADTDLIEAKTLSLSKSTKTSNQSDMILSLTNTADNKVVYPNLKISLRTGNDIKAQFIVTPHNYAEKDNNYLMPNQIKPIKLRIDYPKSKFDQANIEPFY